MKTFKLLLLLLFISCQPQKPLQSNLVIDKEEYKDKLMGFWLGQCVANWTGLITEMDKIGDIGEVKTGPFYTSENWGGPDHPSIWGEGLPSNISDTIEFVFIDPDSVWGADDDTDIEYMYQFLLDQHSVTRLSPKHIKDGWMKHIKAEEENFLWVSNQKSFDLMIEGMLPPATGDPENNEHYDMIDAQLTTEIFGLFSPGHPEIAREMAKLPIQTTARNDAEWISQFYVTMYSLSFKFSELPFKDRVLKIADISRAVLPESSYSSQMYDYVKGLYEKGTTWEQARDSVYQRYQVEQKDGYDITSRNLYCNGCFAAGINFAASLVSLFYGEGDVRETIKIGALCGWDSDNPTATWGGMLGFMLGKKKLEEVFEREFSTKFNIHRTRQNFPQPVDTFENMAETGLRITERVILNELEGKAENNKWIIPN